jgi:glycogen debranching enzyme
VVLAVIRPESVYAWRGPSLFVADTSGFAGPDQPLSGYYFREARFLRSCRVAVNGDTPWLCEVASIRPSTLEFSYTYPEVAEYGGGGSGQSGDEEPTQEDGIQQRALDLRVRYEVGIDRLTITAVVANRARRQLDFELAWQFDADFADIQEAQSGKRQQHAPVRVNATAGAVEFAYEHERLRYRTSIVASGDRAFTWRDGWLGALMQLSPRQQTQVIIQVRAIDLADPLTDEDVRRREQWFDRWAAAFARVASSGNRTFEDAVTSNVRDFASFALLEGRQDEWLSLQAGMPLYPALFGRDAVTAGWQAGLVDGGASLEAALTRLGRMQSSRDDDWRDEEPGRIPYQVRRGPLALLNLNPYAAYYADFASPLMYVISLANLYMWTGDDDRVRRHWDTARRILDWARERGDRDRDGYLEYETRSRQGTKNQGWKDSGDAITYDDGTPVPPPIATCDLQGYWYAAQQLFGVLSWMFGASGEARALLDAAGDLKARFNRDWWVEQQSFFALAMDRDKQLVAAPTSNVGHCLASGIIDKAHLPPVVGRLFAPDMFSGWGIRTLSAAHAYYNPISYHRGTVWAVEQATILFGLRRFGFDARAHDLATALFDLAKLYPQYRIPECVGGYARAEHPSPGAYPQSNTPQLWNASAFPLMIQTLLGLLPVAPYQTLILDPSLPAWLPDLTVHDLKVGGATVTLRCWRDTSGVSHFDVVRKRGELRIVRQPPPESVAATFADRFAALLETVLH